MSFLPFTDIIMRVQRMVWEQSENGQSIFWPFFQPGPLGQLMHVYVFGHVQAFSSGPLKKIVWTIVLSRAAHTTQSCRKK